MEYTPDRPDYVPPSPEVREAQVAAALRKRLRWARFKHLGPWILFAASNIVLVVAIDEAGLYWAYPPLLGLYTVLVALAHTVDADRVYQRAFDAGVSTGVLVSSAIQRHMLDHRRKGEEPCDAGRAKVLIPHVWEHGLVRPEVMLRDDDEEDDEEDEPFNHRTAP